MKKQIDAKWFSVVCGALIASDAKTAVKFLDDKTVVRATWHNKPLSRNYRETMVVSYGAPNYREVAFIKACKKAGEPLPVKKIQLRAFPVKKKTK